MCCILLRESLWRNFRLGGEAEAGVHFMSEYGCVGMWVELPLCVPNMLTNKLWLDDLWYLLSPCAQ